MIAIRAVTNEASYKEARALNARKTSTWTAQKYDYDYERNHSKLFQAIRTKVHEIPSIETANFHDGSCEGWKTLQEVPHLQKDVEQAQNEPLKEPITRILKLPSRRLLSIRAVQALAGLLQRNLRLIEPLRQ